MNLIKKTFLIATLCIQSIAVVAQAQQPSVEEFINSQELAASESANSINEKIEILRSERKILSYEDLMAVKAKDSGPSYFIPLSLTNQELITLAAATSLGIVAFRNDKEIRDVVSSNQSKSAKMVSTIGNFIGGDAVFPISAGAYFLGVLYEDNKLKQVGVFTVGASLAMGIVTAGVKKVAGRVRPGDTDDQGRFFEDGNESFYSGHTAQSFTIATVIAEMYKEDYPLVPWVAYGIAAVTAYARVHDNAHWASDVIMGAVAGHLITKLYLSAFREDDQNRSGVIISPRYDKKNGTFGVDFQFVTDRQKNQLNSSECGKIENVDLRVKACLQEHLN